jgi:hypothetical protein
VADDVSPALLGTRAPLATALTETPPQERGEAPTRVRSPSMIDLSKA